MRLYFEFEEKRRQAEVHWPKDEESIIVHIKDKELLNKLPEDLYFEVGTGNKVTFITEDSSNDRLVELQNVLRRRLQEFVNKS